VTSRRLFTPPGYTTGGVGAYRDAASSSAACAVENNNPNTAPALMQVHRTRAATLAIIDSELTDFILEKFGRSLE
jgi:hypothetical protein